MDVTKFLSAMDFPPLAELLLIISTISHIVYPANMGVLKTIGLN